MTSGSPEGPSATRWSRVDAALDELLALAPQQRAAAIARIAGGDAAFASELRSLVAEFDGADSLLDHPAAHVLSSPLGPAPGLAAGTRLGPWRVVALLGRGGMGEVYRAERADGQFEQQVAIKLMRLDAATPIERFRAERQIVARLDHPGIARLLDGDVSSDGRPYMVMELVDGRHLIDWCTCNGATLAQRLTLFAEVCDAVAYAHRHLVVHRDLKPANVLVTPEGRVKLLDFGIARLLDTPAGETTQELLLTPGYAAPEQLTGGPITTAADVHALGLLLHELLCRQPAYAVQHLALAAAMQQVIHGSTPAPSRVALDAAVPPVAPAALAGDLDAIVAKALRKEPAQRYTGVDELRADVERHRRQEPVLARRGNWAYVATRALRRHRGWAVGIGVALVAVPAGTGAVAWQARVARDEAVRATAVKNFLLQVFKASDPRIASDKPRGQDTARELLDVGAERIEREFKAQPGLEIELLGSVADLYRELGESERYLALQAWRVALAHRYPGRYPQVEIEALLSAASDDLVAPDRTQALAHLAQADTLLESAALDASALRARWWLTFGQAQEPTSTDARRAAYERALALYERHAPRAAGRITTLTERALLAYDLGDSAQAVRGYRAALAAEAETDDRDDGESQVIWGNLGQAYLNLGQYAEAESALKQAEEIAKQTYGERHGDYWTPASLYARLLHLNGRRDEAMQRFEALRQVMPDPPNGGDAWEAASNFAERLTAQGDAARALPIQEAARREFASAQHAPNSLRRASLLLGETYEQLGRVDALAASSAAMTRWKEVRGFRDVRMGVSIQRVHARALLAAGDRDGARAAASAALADSLRYDAPGAASIAEAHALLAQAGAASAPVARR